jgi:hypothetical protein
VLLALAVCGLPSPPARASGASSLSFELNAVGGYSDRHGWSSEIPESQRNSIGLEYYRKVASETGDFLTLDLQARLSYDSREPGGDAVGLEIHNAWAEYKLGLGSNLVVGHFSPAHGLEPVTDTHGTILQSLAMWDIGFKKDWGVGYRGILGSFDLSVAAQLGAGMGIQRSDGSYLVTAQVWQPPGDDLRYGLSVLAGRVLSSRGGWTAPAPDFASEAAEKLRAGLAIEYAIGSFEFAGEASAGKDDERGVVGALIQGGYVPPSLQSLTIEAQVRMWSGDLEDENALRSSAIAGGSYQLTRGWTVRAYLTRDFAKPDGDEDTSVLLQTYFFGG